MFATVARSSLLSFSLLLTLVGCAGDKTDDSTNTTPDDSSAADSDGDGYGPDDDCDDNDATVNPSADEECNGLDDNCDGIIDEGVSTTYYADTDGDGFGNDAATIESCDAEDGWVAVAGDCDDDNPYIYPDAEEICDGADNDCNGTVDDGLSGTYYEDVDGDGYGDPATETVTCDPAEGMVTVSDDCNDDDSAYHPGATEDDCSDPNDYNCDGSSSFEDADGDGYAACEDCDDSEGSINAGSAEVCDDVDNDCDGLVDDADDDTDVSSMGTWYTDADGDTYGDPDASTASCDAPAGTVANDDDCDDTDRDNSPAGTEVCDGEDNDCDGVIDDNPTDGETYYADTDGDGFGDADTSQQACDDSAGWVSDATDCDDTDDEVNPDATEVCNGYDDDCDTVVDDADRSLDDSTTSEWYADTDGDGYGDADNTLNTCDMPTGYVADDNDCDDSDDEVNPGATEVCNGYDDDCDRKIDGADSSLDSSTETTWYEDADGDGFGDASSHVDACDEPAGYVDDNTDCDDGNAGVNPDEEEVCDELDQDCDGVVDDDAVDGGWYAEDDDEDGFGTETLVWACDGPDNSWDCNDANAGEPQVVDASATASSADGTLDAPWTTIQEGIDQADECVLVYPGTYTEAIDFNGRDVAVSSTDGAASTTIDATGLGAPAVTFDSGESSAASLSGFTVTGGSGAVEETSTSTACSSTTTCTEYYTSYCGGGVYANAANPTLSDLIVIGNALPEASTTASGDDTYYVYSFGGGVCLMGASVVMTGVHVYQNFADQGGGVYLDESSTVEHIQSYIAANGATDGAGYEVDGGDATLTNIVSSWNDADSSGGGALLIDGTLSSTNVTFGADDATDGILVLSGTSSADVLNTIIYGTPTGYGVYVDSTATYSGSYNDVYDNATDEYYGITDPTGTLGNISGNPRFYDVTDDGDHTNDDWHIRTTSAAYNAGSSATAYKDADGSRNDMGAYGGPESDWD